MTLLDSTRLDHNEQTIAGMFQPDPLTPYDYLRTSRRTVHLGPEKHLMHAILEEAIKTFRLHVSTKSRREHRLFLEAELWIMDRNDEWLFSFENVCEVLGFRSRFRAQWLGSLERTASRPHGGAEDATSSRHGPHNSAIKSASR